MPFVTRNEKGQIIGIFKNEQHVGQEFIDDDNVQLADLRDYREKRAAEYPPIGDQLDAIWKGGADAEVMRQKIIEIKQKYPKG